LTFKIKNAVKFLVLWDIVWCFSVFKVALNCDFVLFFPKVLKPVLVFIPNLLFLLFFSFFVGVVCEEGQISVLTFVLSVPWHFWSLQCSSSLVLLENDLGGCWVLAEVQSPFECRL